jgi:hypothetical protein
VNKKEQSALRAVIKCVEDRKLEAEFPVDDLRKQLEELEKAKTEKKKAASSASSGGSSGPASKRIRASHGGPMPPAKTGCVSSLPAPSHTYATSSPSHASYATASPSHAVSYTTASPSHASYATASLSHTSYTASPSHAAYATASPYPYDRVAGHGLFQSPQAIREPYVYSVKEVANVSIAMPYPSPPMSYPAPYSGYGNGMVAYNNGMAPAFHQAYYR